MSKIRSMKTGARTVGLSFVLGALRSVAIAALLAASFLLDSAGQALSQGRPQDDFRGVTVLNRPRPEYERLGIRYGAFTVRGSATIDQGYNDNVFYSARNRRGDNVTLARVDASVTSGWSRHGVRAFGSVSRLQYYSLSDQSYTNGEIGASGRYDLTPDTEVSVDASTAVSHLLRTDPDAVPSDEPIEFRSTTFGAGLRHTVGRYILGLRGSYRTLDYKEYSFNGVTVPQSGRVSDLDVYSATASVAYVIGPFRTAIGGVRVTRFEYTSVPTGFLDLSSKAYYAFVGFNYDFDGIWRYEFDAGYIYQQYDEGRIDNLSGPSGTVRVTWAPTALLAITGTASRVIAQQLVTVPGQPQIDNGFFSNRVGLSATYELYRNVLITGGVLARYDEFRGPRGTALFLEENIAVNILLDRTFRAGAFYVRQDTLNENSANPSRNLIGIRLSAAL